MVTQRVAPIRPDDYHGGKSALDEMLARSPHAVEEAEALDDDVCNDTAPLGLAVNTRNYQALLDNLARRRRTNSGSSVSSGGASPAYRRQTLAMGAMYQQQVENQVESPIQDVEMAQTVAEEEEHTVVGLPVDTRNYEAIVSGSRPIRSDPGTYNLMNRRATVATLPQMPQPVQENEMGPVQSQPVGEDDAVMGLPISTGNYVAYLAGQQGSGIQQAGHRNRGYSNLAQEKEPRVSDPYLSSSRRGKFPQESYTTAPSNNNQNDPRPSCFDNRRVSNAAYVPHAGWVFIQHGAFKSWKRYYAVLSGMEFKYSKGVGQSPKGFGLLISVHRMDDLRYGLLLEFGDGSKLQIRCPSDSEFEQWLEALEKAIERNQTLNSQSKTSYTLTASEQHEGYLFKQEKNKTWKRCFFVVRIDGYIECRDSEHG
ncbi:Dynein light chain, partial [Phytophthora palmivora]